MTADELVLMEIKSLIFDMPPDGQKLVEQAMNELKDVLKKYPEGHAHIAMAMVVAQVN